MTWIYSINQYCNFQDDCSHCIRFAHIPRLIYVIHTQYVRFSFVDAHGFRQEFRQTCLYVILVLSSSKLLSGKARSNCAGICKKDTKRKKKLPSIEKRYASNVLSLRTFFIRSTYQASVHCDFIRWKLKTTHKSFLPL